MFTPGIISFQVIIPGSPVFAVNCDPVGLTSAVPVTVTLPVDKVNAFPVTAAVTSIITVGLPIPRVTCEPVGLTTAVPVTVTVPVPRVT